MAKATSQAKPSSYRSTKEHAAKATAWLRRERWTRNLVNCDTDWIRRRQKSSHSLLRNGASAVSKIWTLLTMSGCKRTWRNCLDGGKKLLKRKDRGACKTHR